MPDNNVTVGGGNSPHRFTARAIAKQESMVGEYKIVQLAGGIELRKVAGDE
jgi:hypothetical protein